MSDPAQESVVEMELSPETAKYRQNRLLWWSTLRAGYDDYVADALKHGATQAAAQVAASKHQSSEARALLSELLTRAPVEAIVAFLSVTRELGDPALLFEHDAAVVALIETAYPRRTWATKMDLLKKEVAADDASWSVWAAQWGQEFGCTGKEALEALAHAGKAAGEVGLGLADAIATLLRWSPYILGGAVFLGVVVAANRK